MWWRALSTRCCWEWTTCTGSVVSSTQISNLRISCCASARNMWRSWPWREPSPDRLVCLFVFCLHHGRIILIGQNALSLSSSPLLSSSFSNSFVLSSPSPPVSLFMFSFLIIPSSSFLLFFLLSSLLSLLCSLLFLSSFLPSPLLSFSSFHLSLSPFPHLSTLLQWVLPQLHMLRSRLLLRTKKRSWKGRR